MCKCFVLGWYFIVLRVRQWGFVCVLLFWLVFQEFQNLPFDRFPIGCLFQHTISVLIQTAAPHKPHLTLAQPRVPREWTLFPLERTQNDIFSSIRFQRLLEASGRCCKNTPSLCTLKPQIREREGCTRKYKWQKLEFSCSHVSPPPYYFLWDVLTRIVPVAFGILCY